MPDYRELTGRFDKVVSIEMFELADQVYLQPHPVELMLRNHV